MRTFRENKLFIKSKNKLIRIIKSNILVLIFYLFRIFPISRNKIVVNSYRGMGYYGNPKYIIENLLSKNTDCKIIWLTSCSRSIIGNSIKVVPYHTLRSIYHLVTARIWIDNCRKDYWTRKRKKQFYIQTWHGGIGPKRVEKDIIGKISNEYILGAINDSKMADLFISNSEYLTNIYKECFWYDGDFLEKGLPRNDVLLSNKVDLISKNIRKVLNISNSTKVILFAPTFRKDFDISHHKIDFSDLVDFLDSNTNFNWVVLLHLHPNLYKKSTSFKYSEKLINGNNFDTQELIIASDVLITDYSSIMFDFALTRKPVFLYAHDMVDYKKDRDFRFDIYSLPFKCTNNISELINEFIKFDYRLYVNSLEKLFNDFGIKESGNASEEIVNIIINKIMEEL